MEFNFYKKQRERQKEKRIFFRILFSFFAYFFMKNSKNEILFQGLFDLENYAFPFDEFEEESVETKSSSLWL